mmetsp:Transcript_16811/g.36285  ORF Transcript_16811/g.36285 Transcript_16811/m.36285 type:complete len:248 (+) Transcript_16811:607-1350(+)
MGLVHQQRQHWMSRVLHYLPAAAVAVVAVELGQRRGQSHWPNYSLITLQEQGLPLAEAQTNHWSLLLDAAVLLAVEKINQTLQQRLEQAWRQGVQRKYRTGDPRRFVRQALPLPAGQRPPLSRFHSASLEQLQPHLHQIYRPNLANWVRHRHLQPQKRALRQRRHRHHRHRRTGPSCLPPSWHHFVLLSFSASISHPLRAYGPMPPSPRQLPSRSHSHCRLPPIRHLQKCPLPRQHSTAPLALRICP